MRSVAAVVAIPVLVAIVLALTGLVQLGPGSALVASGRLPGQSRDGVAVRLDLADISPRIVTAGGPGTLTVLGTVTNTGTVPVEELVVRVQRGDPLTTEGGLHDALDGSAATDAVAPQFAPLTAGLAPGEQAAVRLTIPLEGPPDTTLALANTGVHEVLVNVNGAPEGGERARLAAVRLLLPVLSLPSSAPSGRSRPTSATPFALLYPITDTPRRISTVPGETTLLTDDGLAASFAPEGRLGGLVAALAERAPVGSSARQATCLAIDPDLAETAVAMRGGYQVRGPDGTTVAGAGSAVAGQWLDQLVAAARGGCVIALPYADADLVALTRGGLGEAAVSAIVDGRQVLVDILQTPVVPGVTWPADGFADEPALDTVTAAAGRAMVLSADGVGRSRGRPGAGVVPVAGGRTPQFAVLTDPLLTLAASGPADPAEPSTGTGGAAAASTLAGTNTPLSTQDTIGALVFRAESGGAEPDGAPLVLAPPHQWAAEGLGARALLGAVGQLFDAGSLTPLSLDGVIGAGPPAGAVARPLAYPLTAGGREILSSAVDEIRTAAAGLVDLRSAVVDVPDVDLDAGEVFAPLTRGLVRPASAAWRGRPGAGAVAATTGLDRVAEIRGTIRVLEPPSPYSLGTSDAPLPVTVTNGLPLTVKVRIEVSSTSGLRVAPIPELQIPPLGRRQVSTTAQVTRSGRFTVDAAVRTPGGGLLGPPSRLEVRSTAYGTITVWLTAGGGVLLVVLVVRRILRRIRGEPKRPTPGPGGGTPPTPSPNPDRAPNPAPDPTRRRPEAVQQSGLPPHPGPPPPGPARPGPPRVPSPRR